MRCPTRSVGGSGSVGGRVGRRLASTGGWSASASVKPAASSSICHGRAPSSASRCPDRLLGQRAHRTPGQPADRLAGQQVLADHLVLGGRRGDDLLAGGQPDRGCRVLVPPPGLGRHRVRVGGQLGQRGQAVVRGVPAVASARRTSSRPAGVAAGRGTPPARSGRPRCAGFALTAATIAASGSVRPGATSRRAASRSRACHSARTIASCRRVRRPWMPEVRRHGSARGGPGGALQHGVELLLGPVQLAGPVQLGHAAPSRSSISSSTSSAA